MMDLIYQYPFTAYTPAGEVTVNRGNAEVVLVCQVVPEPTPTPPPTPTPGPTLAFTFTTRRPSAFRLRDCKLQNGATVDEVMTIWARSLGLGSVGRDRSGAQR